MSRPLKPHPGPGDPASRRASPLAHRNGSGPAPGFSPQQARIVELLIQGKTDKEIAAAMNLSVPTVRTYLGRMFARLGVASRMELVVRVLTHRPPPEVPPKAPPPEVLPEVLESPFRRPGEVSPKSRPHLR